MLSEKLSSVSAEQIFSNDVFSTYLYTGNGSTQTINNGIDLAGKGGMVWLKVRSGSYGTTDHVLFDTVRGAGRRLCSNTTAAEFNGGNLLTGFGASGFTLNSSAYNALYEPAGCYASWTFRKAPKFFDVVTYTGNGVAGRQIAHSLGVAPGMVIIKHLTGGWNWYVYHRSLAIDAGGPKYLQLDQSVAAIAGDATFFPAAPTDSVFQVGASNGINGPGVPYVAYLFAHDTSADGIIQCGSYTGNGGALDVTLGWEPQYILVRNASQTQDWVQFDTMRGLTTEGGNKTYLNPNLSAAESSQANFAVCITSTGFKLQSGGTSFNSSGDTFIYLAIRRPNKPPTVGTQVFNAIARTGTGAAATVTGVGFAPDLVMSKNRTTAVGHAMFDRLRGAALQLNTSNTGNEIGALLGLSSFNQDGYSVNADGSEWTINNGGQPYINHFFKRAPGVFDVVCYSGNGTTQNVNHSLQVAPEFVIVKSRNAAQNWVTHHTPLNKFDVLNGAFVASVNGGGGFGNNSVGVFPTNTAFTVSSNSNMNNASQIYVAYLFATLAGISKVGSYTGNGSTQTINCGFTTGARFILIKRTDAVGDWYVWDTARGVVAGTEPHLSLNTTVAEVTTDDSIDPDTSGFIVNQLAATNINVSAATYIFLAFA